MTNILNNPVRALHAAFESARPRDEASEQTGRSGAGDTPTETSGGSGEAVGDAREGAGLIGNVGGADSDADDGGPAASTADDIGDGTPLADEIKYSPRR